MKDTVYNDYNGIVDFKDEPRVYTSKKKKKKKAKIETVKPVVTVLRKNRVVNNKQR